jgi:hypothetical protein
VSEILRQTIESASPADATNAALCKQIGAVLGRHYPNHIWKLEVAAEKGVVNVFLAIMSTLMGFRIPLVSSYSASEFEKRVMLAGGELLERYRQQRGGLNDDEYRAAPVDFAGRHTAAL